MQIINNQAIKKRYLNHKEKPQMANKKLLRFSCFRIRKCPHFVSIGCNGKQIGVFGLHCRQDLFAIPGEKIINPTD